MRLLLIAAATAGAISVITRFDPEVTAGPPVRAVHTATTVAVGGAGWVVVTAVAVLSHGAGPGSRPLIVALTALAVVAIGTTGRARLHSTHPGSVLVTAFDAVASTCNTARSRTALAVAIGSAASFAYAGITAAPALVVVALVVPAAAGWSHAKARAATRTEFAAAFAGLLSGGGWTRPLEDAGRSPVTCHWDGDGDDAASPARISMPLPSKWAAAGVEALEAEVSARLAGHGQYVVRVELGSTRRITATLVPPMPTAVRYDGRPAFTGTKVWLGVGQATREHAATPGGAGKGNGDLLDVHIDFRVEPHALAVGSTGSGKSQTVSLIMLQLALAGWKLILLDPKRVEFAAWEGRPGVLKVATELPEMVAALVNARDEMERRYTAMRAAGVNHLDLLPAADRPPRLMIVVDEVVELLTKTPGKSDDAKEQNEVKDQAGEAIGSILQLGRAAGVHLLVAGQRVERSLFSGTWQNNMAVKILHGRADAIERAMIGLSDVVAAPGVPGRAVMRSLGLPQTEVQVAYVDLQKDLDRWLPVGGVVVPPVLPVLSAEDLVPPVQVDVVGDAPTDTVTQQADPSTDDGDSARKPVFAFVRVEPLPEGDAEAALDAMIGLAGVKGQVRQLSATVQVAAERLARGLGGDVAPAPNLLFVGPPGTGKTVTARIIASMLRDVGALTSGHLIEADRASLIAGYVGHTAMAVDAAFEAAKGGVLFIDEAYSLVDGRVGGFGDEAIAAILKRAEDMRGEVVVIMAGYPAEMDALLDSNPGLRSRFPDTGRIAFEAYSDGELSQIFVGMVAGAHRLLGEGGLEAAKAAIAACERGKDWGNARSVRGMVEAACARADTRLHADGLGGVTDLDLITLTPADITGDGADGVPDGGEAGTIVPPAGDEDFGWMDDLAG